MDRARRRGHSRLVAAPPLPLAARAGAQGALRPLQEGLRGRDQLQRRAGRSLHHRREPPPRPAHLAAPRHDAGGRGLLDPRAGRAAPARLHPGRHPRAHAAGRCRMTIACGLLPVLQPDEHDSDYEISDYEGAPRPLVPRLRRPLHPGLGAEAARGRAADAGTDGVRLRHRLLQPLPALPQDLRLPRHPRPRAAGGHGHQAAPAPTSRCSWSWATATAPRSARRTGCTRCATT